MVHAARPSSVVAPVQREAGRGTGFPIMSALLFKVEMGTLSKSASATLEVGYKAKVSGAEPDGAPALILKKTWPRPKAAPGAMLMPPPPVSESAALRVCPVRVLIVG